MFIQDISIKNYRCYKDLNLKFKTGSERNIVLLTGETEAGKTSLVNAMGWCLYGKETQELLKTKLKTKEKPIPNQDSYDSSGATRVSVRMTIKIPELPQMDTIVIKREAKFIKGRSNPVFNDPPKVEVYNKNGTLQPYSDPNQLLSYILVPEELASFYLFDGEYLKQTEFDAEINHGFNKLFRIDTFKTVETVLDDISSDYSKEAQKSDTITTELKGRYKELEDVTDEINRGKGNLKEIEEELTKFRKEKGDVEQEAKATYELTQMKAKYEKLKAERDIIGKMAGMESKNMATEILQNAYLLNANGIINDAIKKISVVDEVKNERLPPEVKETFLRGLLKDGVCICGTVLGRGSDAHKHIEERIPQIAKINEKEFLTDLMSKLEYRININKKKRELIDEGNKKLKEYGQQSDKLDRDITAITSKNKDIDKEMVQNPIEKIQWLDSQIKLYEARMDTAKKEIDELQNRKEAINDKIIQYGGKQNEKSIFLKNMEITDALSSIISAFSKQAIEKFSELLEAEINTLLSANEKLSKFRFERKVISNNEVIFTFKEIGEDMPYFSGGQTQLKGIILVAAFSRIIDRVARSKLPIPFVIMDHPIADVDTKRIEKIAGEMGDMFQNSQVILFVADNKYDIFSDLAKEHISNRFLIKNDIKTKQSYIEEIKK